MLMMAPKVVYVLISRQNMSLDCAYSVGNWSSDEHTLILSIDVYELMNKPL